MKTLNCDVNAGYPLLEAVSSRLSVWCDELGNPSSVHHRGQRAKLLIEQAREEVAEFLGVPRSARVVFTSGGTEANNTAVNFAKSRYIGSGIGIITSSVEHPSILESVKHSGVPYRMLPVSESGALNREALFDALNADTILLSLMAANNETGVIFPLYDIIPEVRKRFPNITIHVDATQAAGKSAINLEKLNADLVTVSAHKLGALSGVGALIVREGFELSSYLRGGAQEHHHRAGTENVLGILSFGLAAKIWRLEGESRRRAMEGSAQIILDTVREEIPAVLLNGEGEPRIPNTLNLRFDGISGDDLVVALDIQGICVSSGAACASGKPDASHVLVAMGLAEHSAKQSIRISVGSELSEEEALLIGQKIIETVRKFSR